LIHLIQHGAKLDIKNLDGNSALHIAAIKGQTECVEVLLDHGRLLVNAVNDEGCTDMNRRKRLQERSLVHSSCLSQTWIMRFFNFYFFLLQQLRVSSALPYYRTNVPYQDTGKLPTSSLTFKQSCLQLVAFNKAF
jgi:ankyrin repeat protein